MLYSTYVRLHLIHQGVYPAFSISEKFRWDYLITAAAAPIVHTIRILNLDAIIFSTYYYFLGSLSIFFFFFFFVRHVFPFDISINERP